MLMGRLIAFMSTRDGPSDVYVMAADGSDIRRLTEDQKNLCCPDWSPDGARIVFHASGSVHTMSDDGSSLLSLGRGALPRWSPDGEWIVFVRAMQIHLMRADGSDVRRITDVEGRAVYPVWSPDGKNIAFTMIPKGLGFEAVELYVVGLDGKEPVRLTDNDVLDGHANWW
jgi:TolB protein